MTSSTTAGTTTLDDDAARHLAAAADAATELQRTLSGTVHRPGDPGYEAALGGFNLALVHRPGLVVQAASPADVALALRSADRHGLGVGVRSTGHSAAPTGPADVLLDTSQMNRLEIDPETRTATIGAGVRWRAVLDAAAPYGLGGLCGSSPDVGVVGYTLGGGLGPLARTFGFAADHVRSLDVVTPAGDVVTASPTRHRDLFWALRGGGGAFGVVTAMTFDLFELAVVRAGALWFDVADAPAVLHRWRALVGSLPESVSTSVVRIDLLPLPHLPEPLRGRAVLVVRYVRHGALDAPDPLVDELRRTATPILDTVGDLPYARIGEVHADPAEPMPLVERGATLHSLPEQAVDAFLAATPAGSPVLLAELRLLGGAATRPPRVSNAVGGRDAAYSLFVGAVPAPGGPSDVEDHLRRVVDAMTPWATGASLLNFAGPRDPVSAERVRSSFGAATYARLVALRRRVDPHGVLDPTARWSVARGPA
ncbi:FAD-binding oxidoreductase [Isoptericola jiangsuensis]|uniref:FAD-binding oxidoreductase n=1 Tax=Isoptericola jiangsuensis TaxID=548579 RepID=UPI003AAC6F74